jgi:hypothetical protein
VPRSGIASRMDSCSPDGINQLSVTTRLNETTDNRAVRVNSEVKSQREAISDFEGSLYLRNNSMPFNQGRGVVGKG